eukprot:1421951-Pyramimonas_sp.AAC.1
MLIKYHPNCCGESSSKPHLRPPSLRANGEHLKRAVNMVLQAANFQIEDRMIFMLFDAGKEGVR